MSLHFITSVSEAYWRDIGSSCVSTWNLPGQVTVYIDQSQGSLDWIKDIAYRCELLHVPELMIDNAPVNAKIRKFWGKSVAQMHAIEHRQGQRIIWLDADVVQLQPVQSDLFDFEFGEPVALMNSGQPNDEWESGLVIFNENHGKLDQFVKHYWNNWHDIEVLESLYRPYDAPVLGYTAQRRGWINLCHTQCGLNRMAMEYTKYHQYFQHLIGKGNKYENSSSVSS